MAESKYTDEYLIKVLTEYLNKNGIENLSWKKFNSKNGLPDCYNYQRRFTKNIVELIEKCGFILTESQKNVYALKNIKNILSKEQVIKNILVKQEKLNRPLEYDDFRGSSGDGVTITTIKKYWGNLNEMKKELGIKVNQESMLDNQISYEEAKSQVKFVCYFYKKYENRKEIYTYDMSNYFLCDVCFDSLKKIFKNNNDDIRSFIQKCGSCLNEPGRGTVKRHIDEEVTTSRFEEEFSNYLKKELKLLYNKDFFRNVLYKDIDSNVETSINCDYKILFEGKVIYIEIAGMLRDYDKSYLDKDYQGVKNKIREDYKEKLKIKRDILEKNNCLYDIIFPKDLKNYNLNRFL